MPTPARQRRTASNPLTWRFSSGMLTVAMVPPFSSTPDPVPSRPAHDLQQELQDLPGPCGVAEVPAARVERVPADEEAVDFFLGLEHRPDARGGSRPVLGVLDDGQPLPVLVGDDAVEALQHLVAFDGEAARPRV